MPDGREVTTAVIGVGDISAVHLAVIERNPRCRLVAVCDVDPDRAVAAAAAHGVPAFTDHRALLQEIRPDVVHITTPHHQHVPVALDAIAAGVHVLTEKPVAESVAAAGALVQAARDASVKVGLVLQNRYNPTSRAIRDVIDSGALGPILGGRASVWWTRSAAYYAASPWRGRWSEGGGGVLINQAIHTLDLLIWLLGEPVTVHGTAATLALGDVIEVEDTATVRMQHPDGATSVFFATNTHHTNAFVELEVTGRDGSVALVEGRAVLTDATGSRVLANDTQDSGDRSYWGLGHQLLIDDFYARLNDPEPFWLTPTTGLSALRVLRTTYAQSGLLPSGAAL